MCMGCMANGDFLLTSGILGAASVRVGVRRYLPGRFSWRRKPTRDSSTAAVASLGTTAAGTGECSVESSPAHGTNDRVLAAR